MAGPHTVPLVTALYLAHLNPVTNAHAEIIGELADSADAVKVMPVVFMDGAREINSKSFPFTFEQRKRMVRAVFGDGGRVRVTDDYTFFAPFRRYTPPLISPRSWKLRKRILAGAGDDYFTYTGDRAEGYMLRLYRLRPRVGTRRQLSASAVKEKLYRAASATSSPPSSSPPPPPPASGPGPGGGVDVKAASDWTADVPDVVAAVIRDSWDVVEGFAGAEDRTARVLGMKFPKDGY